MAVQMLLTLERPRMTFLVCFAILYSVQFLDSTKWLTSLHIDRYSMVLADNVDGGDDLDLIVTTMNGNVFCFSTPSPHHPLKVHSMFFYVNNLE